MPFTPGTQVGPYRIIEQLGQGGMATVYKAYHASLDRYVAIKVLHQAFMEDASFQARFQREARLVARLEHTNIVPIYDYAEYEGQPYLVMKFIEGETLKARMQRSPLSPREIVTVVESVGAGMAYAHRQGILHRDIKPSNVILSKDGGIYLADFGLARIAQNTESTLTSDMVLGTPQYISPEQALGKKELDEGTDIYSFGVMLYELTVGRVPFSADTPFSVIHDHIYAPLPLPSDVNPNVSPDLERVLLKALAKERADRHPDVPALVEAFKEAFSSSTQTQLTHNPFSSAESVTPPPARSTASAPLTAIADPRTPPPAPQPVSALAEPAAVSTGSTPLPQPPQKKGRWRWMWLALGVLLISCCLIIFVATRGAGNRPNSNDSGIPDVEATVNAAIETAVPPEIAPTLNAILPQPGSESPDAMMPVPPLDEARAKVESEPDNREAHFAYGLALIEAGQRKEGHMELSIAAEMSQGDNAYILLRAAELERRQLQLGALLFYQQLPADRLQDFPRALENIHRAVYMAYGEPYAPEVLPFGTLGKMEESLVQVAQARYALVHRDDLNMVQGMIEDIRRMHPGAPEAELLQAELFMKRGQGEDARVLLNQIMDADGPEWVKLYAKNLLEKVK